ncbi:smad nuclear interacting protein 1 [Aspergillus udagawae]|uniref:Smad nuclear interacting protein 1 n=1 Tax=Aspergillus udagawae TaxID=91492 RepID=A0ABQ1B8V5_9EURO|nr:smad nuclear interacting protein 1 [Aspergillus udagawae]GFF96325.1 smad nuclear interacting protein 1 [Aspergillus udagawae]GFG09838.1 smad nuclear interacting protein 1 [Aspergillus udagawae]GFG23345.1 smad nuclear interacting protein 1 [Aspergillus udagawae]
MAESRDDYSEKRRRRSPSESSLSARDNDRRRHTRERRRDDDRSSRRNSSRRRSPRSPTRRDARQLDNRDRRDRRERREESDDHRRRRTYPAEERGHRHHRDRDSYDDRGRSSRKYRSRSRSRSPAERLRSPESRALPRSKAPLPSQNDAYTSEVARGGESSAPPPDKEKPNFGNTGRLAAETNTVNVSGGTVVLKYHEPPEARKPPAKEPWRLYVFKGEDLLEVVELAERSCWLIGRERLVADFPLDHPSCSKQHAAIQFRFVEKRNEFGDRIGKVKPYLIDLESANGSHVNGDTIPAGRYVELRDKDVLKFGLSSREYVLMLPQPD